MRTRMFLLSFVVLLAVVMSFAPAAFAADMFTGTWKMNLAKSRVLSPQPTQPAMLTFKAVDNGITTVVETVTPNSREMQTESTVKFDGNDYAEIGTMDGKPSRILADATVSARKINDYTIEFTFKKNGKPIAQITCVVSTDGKTMTNTANLPRGLTATQVYEKQ